MAAILPDEVPAAGYGGRNNLAMGSEVPELHRDCYEIIDGGTGAR